MKNIPFEEFLHERFRKDPEEAMGFLDAVLEESDLPTFLLALQDVAIAFGGMSQVAKKAKLNRVSLYRMLSKKGNPEIFSIDRLLRAFGMRLAVQKA